MRWLLFICFIATSLKAMAIDTEIYRKNLALAPSDKKLCTTMIENLEDHLPNKKLEGYLGAYTMIKANHQFSPISKLNSFNSGKKILDNAINSLPNDIELRYVRYAIQISIPSFLGYKQNLKEDKEILLKQLKNCNPNLQRDIRKLIIIKETSI